MNILHCTKNGQAIAESEIQSFLDPSLCIGEGIYESIQTYHGNPFRLDRHLARLKHSAQLSELELPFPISQIKSWFLELIKEAGKDNQFVKLVATQDSVILASRLREDPDPTHKGLKGCTFPGVRKNSEIKALNISHSYKAREESKKRGCYESILIDDEGNCTEGAFSNLFWVKDRTVFSTRKHALPGITQESVIECLDHHYPFEWDTITESELYEADEIFVSSSLALVPLVEINGILIGNGHTGPITNELFQLFHLLTEKECNH